MEQSIFCLEMASRVLLLSLNTFFAITKIYIKELKGKNIMFFHVSANTPKFCGKLYTVSSWFFF